MIELFFGNIYSILTTIAVIGLLSFAAAKLMGKLQNMSWGRAILLFIAVGLAVSFLSAMRDGYAGESALFSMTSMQSNVCSLAGSLVIIIGLLSLVIKRSAFRRAAFMSITALLVLQVLVIEISRVSMTL